MRHLKKVAMEVLTFFIKMPLFVNTQDLKYNKNGLIRMYYTNANGKCICLMDNASYVSKLKGGGGHLKSTSLNKSREQFNHICVLSVKKVENSCLCNNFKALAGLK